jgi:hypothetical protein
MTTYEITTKGGDTVHLYSDDTFTLALGDPEVESEETIPELLADCFSRDELVRLADQIRLNESIHASAAVLEDGGKLQRAIELAQGGLFGD